MIMEELMHDLDDYSCDEIANYLVRLIGRATNLLYHPIIEHNEGLTGIPSGCTEHEIDNYDSTMESYINEINRVTKAYTDRLINTAI